LIRKGSVGNAAGFVVGPFRRSSSRQKGAILLRGILSGRTVCLRGIAGNWRRQMAFWRFVSNPRVTVEEIIRGWSEQTRVAVAGRHVLAIQDSSDIKFSTTVKHRRGLGRVGKGNIFGVVLHAMMAIDADEGSCLGLVGGRVWTRK